MKYIVCYYMTRTTLKKSQWSKFRNFRAGTVMQIKTIAKFYLDFIDLFPYSDLSKFKTLRKCPWQQMCEVWTLDKEIKWFYSVYFIPHVLAQQWSILHGTCFPSQLLTEQPHPVSQSHSPLQEYKFRSYSLKFFKLKWSALQVLITVMVIHRKIDQLIIIF